MKLLSTYFDFKWNSGGGNFDSRECEQTDLPNVKIEYLSCLCPPKKDLKTFVDSSF